MLVDLGARPATARGAGAGFVLATLGIFAVGLWLDVAADPLGPGAVVAGGWGTPYTALGPVLATMAALILLRHPRQGFGWGLAWLGCFWALDGLSQSWVRYAVRADEALPAANLALWFVNRVGAFLPFSVALLLLLFPTGRFLPGRWRVASWVAVVAMAASAGLVLVAPASDLPGQDRLPPGVDLDLWTVALPASFTAVAQPVTVVASLTGLAVAVVTVLVRYRRSVGRERDRMRWLLWSVLAMSALVAATMLLDVQFLQEVVVGLIMVLPAGAMTVAILDPGLVSIEDLLARTTLYAALAGVVLAVDLAGLWALTAVLGERLDERQVVVTVLLLTALVYGPVRNRLTRWARRLILGRRADRYDTVAGLAATLESTDDAGEQLSLVARAVADAFRVPFVSVEVDRGAGELLTAAWGARPGRTRALPISYRGETVGRLVLPASGIRSRLSARDEELLGDLVRQAAAAARTSRLAEELQASRERLVLAREEERRRIRRDLHDGLGADLSGVVLQLESARLLLERDPDQAKERLRGTAALVQEVVTDVRRLVHDLRPPALDDRGLTGALAQLADRLGDAGPATVVEVDPDPLPALPAAVEVAAYRIVGEALTNVARHARATRCAVRLEVRGAELVVTVRDDGVGVPPDAESGVGLVSLHERAGELGGRAEVSCPPDGGTMVRAELPLEDP